MASADQPGVTEVDADSTDPEQSGPVSGVDLSRRVGGVDPSSGGVQLPDDVIVATAKAIMADRGQSGWEWDNLLDGTKLVFRHHAAVVLRAAWPLVAARVRAEAVADEQRRLADVILPEHWQTMQVWGGVQRLACGRCRYGDGVCFLWPCPTRRAVTGEPEPEADSSQLAAGSVPVATPESAADPLWPYCPTCWHSVSAHREGQCSICECVAGPVATPTEPAPGFETRVEYGHQTAQFGWVPEYRGIRYATHQREVQFRSGEPVLLDHWSDPTMRKPFDRQPVPAEQPEER